MLQGGTRILADADMNSDTYKVPGNYYTIDNATAATLKNAPFNNGFILKVEYSLGNSQPRQTFTNYITGQRATRRFNGTEWLSYAYFSDDATLLEQTTNLKYKNINYGNITIPSEGYIRWAETDVGSPDNQIDGTVLFATIYNWGSNGGHCFNVNERYCFGEANMTITNLNVRFWYIE